MRARIASGISCALIALSACAPTGSSPAASGTGGASATGGSASTSGGASAMGGNASGGTVVTFGGTGSAGEAPVGGGGPVRDPNTCEEAEKFRTYLGCEYFPTTVANVVNSVFDFAVVVANASDQSADVTVTGPNAFSANASVGPHQLATLYLPWVDALKGPTLSPSCNSAARQGASVLAPASAYHLKSSRPVAAYQFNPLEFRAAGGPPGKVWNCTASSGPCACNSYSNEASLLLPKNALTSNYVAFTWRDEGKPDISMPVNITVTAFVDATEIAVRAGPTAQILAGPPGSGLVATMPGDIIRFTLNQGDVAQLVAAPASDLSGTQIQATDPKKPIQVIASSPIATAPSDKVSSADHIEEVVFPAETVGKDYVVPVPTGPHATSVRHVVRIYGVAKASTLSYFPSKPMGAPDSVAPSAVAEFEATADFQIQGSEPFAVGSFLVGGQLLDPAAPATDRAGDPSQSFMTAVAQYRDKYVFLAPIDYESNFADIVVPAGVTLSLDSKPIDLATATTLSGRAQDATTPRDFRVVRVPLDAGPGFAGAHEITASAPVGLQVVGYGRFTSYQYPGGLNLNLISDPPIVIPPR